MPKIATHQLQLAAPITLRHQEVMRNRPDEGPLLEDVVFPYAMWIAKRMLDKEFDIVWSLSTAYICCIALATPACN